NAAQRDRVAAQSLAEADKIKAVTQAEAEAESKRLQGEGVAAQRKAIAMGIAEQYEMLRKVGIEHSAEQLLLMTQYFDTMQDVARNGRSNVLYLPSNPGTVGSMGDEIRNAMLQAQAAGEAEATGKAAPDAFDRDHAQRQPGRQRPALGSPGQRELTRTRPPMIPVRNRAARGSSMSMPAPQQSRRPEPTA